MSELKDRFDISFIFRFGSSDPGSTAPHLGDRNELSSHSQRPRDRYHLATGVTTASTATPVSSPF